MGRGTYFKVISRISLAPYDLAALYLPSLFALALR